MRKIKVVFCIPHMIIGGCESVFIRTLTELEKNPLFDIYVILHDPIQEPFFIDWFNAHKNIKISIMYGLQPFFRKLEPYTKFFLLKKIRKWIYSIYKRIRRFVIKHSKQFQEADVFIDYKNLSFMRELSNQKKPVIGWFHGSINYFNKSMRINRLSYLTKFVCLSDSFVDDFKLLYPEVADKIIRVYNPIDIEKIRNSIKDSETFHGKYFSVVSRQDIDKDLETVIHAFNKFWLKENEPNVKLVLVGTGTKTNTLKQLVAKQESAEHIIFTGSKTNPFGYMNGSMAHILSSYNEGLPTVLIEAQTLGVLNISSNCKSGPKEILLDGAGGLLFESGDVNQLAQHMSAVYNNQIDKTMLINTATAGLERFSAETIIPQIVQLIKSVVEE